MENDLCEYLDWDSTFFRARIARVKLDRLSSSQLQSVVHWCRSKEIDCLYFLAGQNDPDTIRCVEEARFSLVDIRVTLETRGSGISQRQPPAGVTIRPSQLSDVPVLKGIAKRNHSETRFYFDGHFQADLCDSLYEVWIEKSCTGYADSVLVAERDDKLIGYVSCHRKNAESGQIGLLGVTPEAQGRNLGATLVQCAVRWFAETGIEHIAVVTQGRNIKAQRLYQRCGFVTNAVQLWYHKWFTGGTESCRR